MSKRTTGRMKFIPDGEANKYHVAVKGDGWIISLLFNGEIPSGEQIDTMRQMVDRWNAFDGIPEEPEVFMEQVREEIDLHRRCREERDELGKLAHELVGFAPYTDKAAYRGKINAIMGTNAGGAK